MVSGYQMNNMVAHIVPPFMLLGVAVVLQVAVKVLLLAAVVLQC